MIIIRKKIQALNKCQSAIASLSVFCYMCTQHVPVYGSECVYVCSHIILNSNLTDSRL